MVSSCSTIARWAPVKTSDNPLVLKLLRRTRPSRWSSSSAICSASSKRSKLSATSTARAGTSCSETSSIKPSVSGSSQLVGPLLNLLCLLRVESNLEMKEENQMLREQDVIRNELLSRYEKRNEDMTKEVSGIHIAN